jgi:hypothetical protein
MKIIISILILFTMNSCKPQNKEQKKIVENIKKHKMNNQHEYNSLVNKDFEKFDVKSFYNENKEGLCKNYKSLNDNLIDECAGNNDSWFSRDETSPQSLYIIKKFFYSNGNIQTKGLSFINNTGEFGIWYEFDEKGKLIKTIDNDKPYEVNFEDIEAFCKKNKAIPEKTYVYRMIDEKTNERIWNITYNGEYKDKMGKYEVVINDKTGELKKVMSVTGRNEATKKEIIFIKK